VALDSSGNIYVAGSTGGNLDGNLNAGLNDIFLVKYNSSGVKQWTQLLGTTADDVARGIAIDSSDDIYVTGSTGGGLGGVNAGLNDLFLVKYDSSGNWQWSRQLGTIADDVGYGVAADSTGNIYIAGSTGGSLGGVNAGLNDLFLVKYDSSGVKQWTQLLGTIADDVGYGVAADSTGNIYVTGSTGGNLDGIVNAGSNDIFLVKYDSSGVKQWTQLLGTIADDVGYGVAADSTGNIYIAGSTGGSLGGVNAGLNDLFLVKYDSSGNWQWSRQRGTGAQDVSFAIALGGSSNIYLTGSTGGGLDGNINAGLNDLFLVKYDSSGTWEWNRQLGTIADDIAYALDLDTASNIYLTGSTGGGLDGNTNVGGLDIFVVKYDSSGNLQ